MSIVEISDDGALHVPAQLLGGVKPPTKYEMDVRGDTIVLRLAEMETSLWEKRDPAERAGAIMRWANEPRPPAPDIPIEFLGRDFPRRASSRHPKSGQWQADL